LEKVDKKWTDGTEKKILEPAGSLEAKVVVGLESEPEEKRGAQKRGKGGEAEMQKEGRNLRKELESHGA